MNAIAREHRKVFMYAALGVVLAVVLTACATQEQKGDAIGAVNRAFRVEYEAILAEKGTRIVRASRTDAYEAMRVALARVGMQVEAQDPGLGFLTVIAPAPRPLDLAEWRQAAEADLPNLRAITHPYIGALSNFISFEPEGLLVVINATVLSVRAGSEVSLTVRLREVAPPLSGIPRREYVTPSAVRMGLDKIWATFEHELQLRNAR
jgi:hypothetical protein